MKKMTFELDLKGRQRHWQDRLCSIEKKSKGMNRTCAVQSWADEEKAGR